MNNLENCMNKQNPINILKHYSSLGCSFVNSRSFKLRFRVKSALDGVEHSLELIHSILKLKLLWFEKQVELELIKIWEYVAFSC